MRSRMRGILKAASGSVVAPSPGPIRRHQEASSTVGCRRQLLRHVAGDRGTPGTWSSTTLTYDDIGAGMVAHPAAISGIAKANAKRLIGKPLVMAARVCDEPTPLISAARSHAIDHVAVAVHPVVHERGFGRETAAAVQRDQGRRIGADRGREIDESSPHHVDPHGFPARASPPSWKLNRVPGLLSLQRGGRKLECRLLVIRRPLGLHVRIVERDLWRQLLRADQLDRMDANRRHDHIGPGRRRPA